MENNLPFLVRGERAILKLDFLSDIKTHFVFIACVSLIFAGALGNILDSLFYGLMFDSGTVWDPLINGGDGRWIGYPGISNLLFCW